jgi:hypothetical protein
MAASTHFKHWVSRMSPTRRKLIAARLYFGALAALLAAWVWSQEVQRSQTARVEEAVDESREATLAVRAATVNVHTEVTRLAVETASAQRLAIWVGVLTGVVGAILGGFAGAFAAKLLGG